MDAVRRVLVIRRDNIGDLVCTTPMIRLLRERFPKAHIDALVNSYNCPVLDHNPALNHVYSYTKGKHRVGGESLLSVYWAKIRLLWVLRSHKYDLAILPGSGYSRRGVRFARLIGAKDVLGFYESDTQMRSGLTLPVDIRPLGELHEVEYCCALLKPLGINASPTRVEVFVCEEERTCARKAVDHVIAEDKEGCIGIHISARKPSNRWPEASFIELIHTLWEKTGKPIILFWSPGSADHPQHPGDDAMAARILDACQSVHITQFATSKLRDLTAGLSLCDVLICSDGGAMHIATGLGKPVVCLFGDSNAWQWRPWGVPYRLLQTGDRRASSITVSEVLDAYRSLSGSSTLSEQCNS